MPKTTNKGIRFTEEELQRAEALLRQFPEYRTEADLLHQAAMIGLLVLATQAIRPGLPAYAGYAPDDLTALLKYRLMPTIDFLIERNALPITFQRPAGRGRARSAHRKWQDGKHANCAGCSGRAGRSGDQLYGRVGTDGIVPAYNPRWRAEGKKRHAAGGNQSGQHGTAHDKGYGAARLVFGLGGV